MNAHLKDIRKLETSTKNEGSNLFLSTNENSREYSENLILRLKGELYSAETFFYFLSEFYVFAVNHWLKQHGKLGILFNSEIFEYMREKNFSFFVELRYINSDPSNHNKLRAVEAIHRLLFNCSVVPITSLEGNQNSTEENPCKQQPKEFEFQ